MAEFDNDGLYVCHRSTHQHLCTGKIWLRTSHDSFHLDAGNIFLVNTTSAGRLETITTHTGYHDADRGWKPL